MTLKLTPELLRAAYDLLGETEPFKRWNLPDGDEIDFEVRSTKRDYAWLLTSGDRIKIAVSETNVGMLTTLFATLAHEKIHLHQHLTGMKRNHGAAFKKLAAEVCEHHRDFDPKNF